MSRNIERVLASVVVLCFVMPIGMINGLNPVENPVEEINKGKVQLNRNLCLAVGTFDPLKGEAKIPDDLRLSRENGIYILQLKGPRYPKYVDQLESMNVKIKRYVPIDAWIVSMKPSMRAEVEELPWVRWVGNYEPGYKIQPGLFEKKGNVKVKVVFFENEDKNIWGNTVMNSEKYGMRITNKKPTQGIHGMKDTVVTWKEFKEEREVSLQERLKFPARLLRSGTLDELPEEFLSLDITDLASLKLYALRAQIGAVGGKVLREYSDTRFLIELPANRIKELAFSRNVEWIEEYHEPIPFTSSPAADDYVDDVKAAYPEKVGKIVDWTGDIATNSGKDANKNPDAEVYALYALYGADVYHECLEAADRQEFIVTNDDPNDDHGTSCIALAVGENVGDASGEGQAPEAHWGMGSNSGGDTWSDMMSATADHGGRTLSVSWDLGTMGSIPLTQIQ